MSRPNYPDAKVFLYAAFREMARFHDRYQHFPSEWFFLGFGWERGKRSREPDDRAHPRHGPMWRPRRDNHTYVIEEATKSTFVIVAYNEDGHAEWKLTEASSKPVKLRPTICYNEQWDTYPAEVVAEIFLFVAFEAMYDHRGPEGEWPTAWGQLDIHFAFVKHTEDDPRAMVPKDAGSTWRPLGSPYTFELRARGKRDFRIRSHNDQGLPDYFITRSHHARPLPDPVTDAQPE